MRASIVKDLGSATGSVTLLASAAHGTEANAASATVISGDLARAQVVVFEINVTAQSGTTPTLDVEVHASLDKGTTFFELAQFSQYGAATGKKLVKVRVPESFATEIVAAAAITGTTAVANNSLWDTHFRVMDTVTGTTPSYTFVVIAYPFYGT